MKPIQWKLFLMTVMTLLMLTGCGSQDRYEVMPPHVNFIIEDQNWGTATAVPTVHNSFNPSPAAVVDGRFYFGSRGGMVYAVTPTGYETLPRPNNLYVRDLLKGPDELLWMTDNNGRILYYQEGQWELDVDLDLDWDSGTRLLLDNQGRLLLMGDHEDDFHKGNTRGLWRRDDAGQWTKQDIPGDPDIMHGWCEYGQSPVFLTSHLELITEDGDRWQISDPVWDDFDGEQIKLQISEDGRMVILNTEYRDFLLNDGDGWQFIDSDYYMRHLFWFGTELYGVAKYSDELMHWDGEDWISISETIDSSGSGIVWSRPHGSERILYFHSGGSMVFDGLELRPNTQLLGYPHAVVRYGGMDHLYMTYGAHLVGTDGVWQVAGWPDGADDRSSIAKRMVVDDRDMLVFFLSSEIATWDGNEYHRLPTDQSLSRIYLQDDGKVVVLSMDRVGVWSQGELRWMGYLEDYAYDAIGAKWNSNEKIQVLFRDHLRMVEPESSTITLAFQGWTPRVSASGPGSSLACAGIERMVVIEDGDVLDLTPNWGSVQGEEARISAMIADGLGGWIVYDYDRSSLLRFDGESWYDMGVNFWNTIYDGGTLTSNGDGTFILQDYGYVFLIEPGAGI